MTPKEIIQTVRQLGGRMIPHGNALLLRMPRGCITSDLIESAKRHKAVLLGAAHHIILKSATAAMLSKRARTCTYCGWIRESYLLCGFVTPCWPVQEADRRITFMVPIEKQIEHLREEFGKGSV